MRASERDENDLPPYYINAQTLLFSKSAKAVRFVLLLERERESDQGKR